MNTRTRTLETASTLINGDRENDYGTPQENFANIAERWSQTVGRKLEAWEVALMMADLKLARMATVGNPKPDSMIDAAGYIALAAELSE